VSRRLNSWSTSHFSMSAGADAAEMLRPFVTLVLRLRLQFSRGDTLNGSINEFDHVPHRHVLAGALEAGSNLHQAARIGRNHHIGLGRKAVLHLHVAELLGSIGFNPRA